MVEDGMKPWTLTEHLQELERTDPNVRAAARRLDQTIRDILVDAELARASSQVQPSDDNQSFPSQRES